MAELRISELSGGFVLYFETPETRINAYALASTLVNLADAAKAAAKTLDSGIELEVVVEAISSGSFKARVTALARESGLFLAKNIIAPLVLSVIGSYLYEHTLAKHEPIQVTVEENEVLIRQGDQVVVVPRQVHDAARRVGEDPAFTRSMDRMLSSIVIDQNVLGFGLTPAIDSPPPAILLPREAMLVRDAPPEQEEKTRIVEEDCDLYIVKAIMERSKRKWEFKWHGVAISAAIKDPNFYDNFARHDFTIAPGDEFQVKLGIHQRRNDVSGIFANTSYEVLDVYRHISRPKPRNVLLQ